VNVATQDIAASEHIPIEMERPLLYRAGASRKFIQECGNYFSEKVWRLTMRIQRWGKRTTLISWILVFVASCSVMATLSDYGVALDEPAYFEAGRSYLDWLSSPSLSTIDQHWSVNHEHPPLTKILGGLTNGLFNKQLGWFHEYVAYRISLLAFIIPMTLAFFSFARSHLGVWPALLVSLALMFHPQLFFHAHIGASDYAITAMWFVTAYALWRSEESFRWIFLASVALGLSLLTKINGLSLYAIVALVMLMHLARDYRLHRGERSGGQLALVKQVLLRAATLSAIPILVFYACWPWLWRSPVDRIWSYVAFFIWHREIPTYYFGTQYLVPPWHLPPILTLLTTPTLVVLLFLVGLFSRTFATRVRIFILANLILAIAIISLSHSKHDGIRLFLPAIPFLYLIAGAGLVTIYGYLRERSQGSKWAQYFPLTFSALVVALMGLAIVQSVVRYHPFQTAYFNEIVGGDRGAAALGLEYEFWCGSYIDALKWLERHSESTFWVPYRFRQGALFEYYYSTGVMKKKLNVANEAGSQFLILPSRPGFFNATLWKYFKNETPVFSVRAYKENVLNIYAIR
jgi:4-amino-4-deoxy-L-arabinose transferase-like glycosyltransferase